VIDLQTVYPQQVINVRDISVYRDDPRFLFITGDDFSAVESVEIENALAPSFVVISPHQLIAELPNGVTAADVTRVMVLSRQLVLTDDSILRFKLSKRPSKVSGILKLVQLFTKLLLTTPGTDIFRKKVGGSLMAMLGKNTGKKDADKLTADFSMAVAVVTRQLIAAQAVQPQLNPSERLLSANVASVRFDTATTTLLGTIELVSHAGKTAIVNTEL
jgi:hypothetical protein